MPRLAIFNHEPLDIALAELADLASVMCELDLNKDRGAYLLAQIIRDTLLSFAERARSELRPYVDSSA